MAVTLWKVHGDGRKVGPTEVVAPDERLAWPQTIGLGAQHVLAMFGATFLVPVLIGFPPNTTIFFSGIGTLIFLIVTIGRGQRLGLPSYLGSSFAFISPVHRGEEAGRHPGRAGRDLRSPAPSSSSWACLSTSGVRRSSSGCSRPP